MSFENQGSHSDRLDHQVAALLRVYEDKSLECLFTSKAGLPDRRIITQIVDKLPELLTPGHHGPGPRSAGFADRLARRVSWLRAKLIDQITRALRFEYGDKRSPKRYRLWAQAYTDQFFDALPGVIRQLEKDVRAAAEKDPACTNLHEIIATYPGFFAICVYRVAHVLQRLGPPLVPRIPLIPRMMTEVAHSRTGIDIHPGAVIGHGFFIDHGTGVTIGETTIIGNYCTLYQGVTLGALNFPRNEDGELLRGPQAKRHPTLGDHVVVYANASVLGGETVVGNRTKIGANVRLTESIGPEMVVRVDRNNFRVEPRHKLGTPGSAPWELPAKPPAPEAKPSEEHFDRLLISKLANESPANGNSD